MRRVEAADVINVDIDNSAIATLDRGAVQVLPQRIGGSSGYAGSSSRGVHSRLSTEI